MKYHPFAFWLVALIIGILLASYLTIDSRIFLMVGIFCFFIYLLFFILKKTSLIFLLCGFVFIVCIGALRYIQSNSFVEGISTLEKKLFYIEVDNLIKPSAKFNKYYATILPTEDDAFASNQRILVYIRKGNKEVHQDDRLWIYGSLQSIPPPKNPHAFDYKEFMAKKRIHYQIFSDTLVSLSHANTWQHRLSKYKQSTKRKLSDIGFSKTSQIFISSLALGDRMILDRAFQETLSSAGVMHLFAISGLHVGIIFTFIMILLYPLLYLPRGKILRWIVALIIIWVFAWFVDFTSSVTRAVFMISIYYLTLILQRTTNIFHTLALTAFVLLLVDPNEIFQVGFQLSYSAVFFIAWLYRPIRNLLPHYRKPYKNVLFDIMSISTTAQFGVMPISVFYFNKFSLLFLIGNLVIIPFASLMVITSLLTVFVIHTGYLPQFWVLGTNYAFLYVHLFLDYLTSFDNLILKNISWNLVQVTLLIILLVLTRRLLIKFKWQKLIPVFLVIFLFQLTRLWNAHQFAYKNELIVFHQYKGTVVGIRQGNQLDAFWYVEDSINVKDYIINPYALNEQVTDIKYHNLLDDNYHRNYIKEDNLLKFFDKTYYITTSRTTFLPPTDYVILTQSPPSLKLYDSVKTKRIIADGSNYPYIIQNLKKQTNKVYYTLENGAYLETIQ